VQAPLALGPRWVRAPTVHYGHPQSSTVANGSEEPQVADLSGHAAGMIQVGDSDCGPEGHRASRRALTRRRPEYIDGLCSRPGTGGTPPAEAAAPSCIRLQTSVPFALMYGSMPAASSRMVPRSTQSSSAQCSSGAAIGRPKPRSLLPRSRGRK
jgi:hypothetical protein